jgi:hypothetical protein
MGGMREVVPFHEEDAQAAKNSDMESRGRNLFIVRTIGMLSNLGLLKEQISCHNSVMTDNLLKLRIFLDFPCAKTGELEDKKVKIIVRPLQNFAFTFCPGENRRSAYGPAESPERVKSFPLDPGVQLGNT